MNSLEPIKNLDSIEEQLVFLNELKNEKVVFSTSFGIEDQLISHFIFKNNLTNIEVFTLDTGRLFPETYATWEKTELVYNTKIKSYYPESGLIEEYVNENGINGFYNSVPLRKECCNIRKVLPLQRALKNVDIWITGLRSEQSPNREQMELVEHDENFNLYKINPLINWTFEEVNDFVKKNAIPYNSLHKVGYVSIGCAPCTRAIKEGEDFRAGRWWWEDVSKKECGLHSK